LYQKIILKKKTNSLLFCQKKIKFFTCYSTVIIPIVPTLSLHHNQFSTQFTPTVIQNHPNNKGHYCHYIKPLLPPPSLFRLSCSFQSGNNNQKNNKTQFSLFLLCCVSDFTQTHTNPKFQNPKFVIFFETPFFLSKKIQLGLFFDFLI
jgi:hypothetical protein